MHKRSLGLPLNVAVRPALNTRHQVIPLYANQHWFWRFSNQWKDCQACPLAKTRNRVVQFRGIIPADILFIGEAPGTSEDEIGRPFCGPAGKLFDELLEECGIQDGDFAVINVLGCISWNAEHNGVRKPSKPEIKACKPRFTELFEKIKPKHVVLMGDTAGMSLPLIGVGTEFVSVPHPAAILRAAPSQAVVLRKRFTLGVRQILQ